MPCSGCLSSPGAQGGAAAARSPPGSTPIPFLSHLLLPRAVISSRPAPLPILPTRSAAFYNPNPEARSAAEGQRLWGHPARRGPGSAARGKLRVWDRSRDPPPVEPEGCSRLLAPWQSRRRDVRVFLCGAHRMLQAAKGCAEGENTTSISSPASEPAGRETRGKGASGRSGFLG